MNIGNELREKAHEIIHSTAIAATTAAGAMAQLPGADIAILTTLHLEMIKKISELFGKNLDHNMAQDILQKATKIHPNAIVSKSLLGWIPGIGNAANASLTFNNTQAIGWFIFNYFKEDQFN